MDVLAGNEAGQRTAKEGAHGAKLLGLAEAPGRDAVHLPPPRFLVAYVIALHGHAGHLLLPVGVKSLRQKVVDRHVIASDIEREDRKSVEEGKGVSVRDDIGGRSIIKKKNKEL